MRGLEGARRVYSDPTSAVRSAKAQGLRVVGYFCDSLPIELIEAGGMMAHRITGYPAPARQVLEERLFALMQKAFWQVRQSSLGFINDSFGRLVDGTYDLLDALVIPNTRKPLLNMYGHFLAAKADDPGLKVPHLFVLDRAKAPVASAHAFNRASVDQFWSDLEKWSGKAISEDAVREAVRARSTNRAALQAVNGWRRLDPPRISGAEFLALTAAFMFMQAHDFSTLVNQVLQDGPGEPRIGPRIFVGGSPPDNDQLYRIIEALGATVVGEDHCWGERCSEPEEPDSDMHRYLASRWDCSPACGFRFPYEAAVQNVVDRARGAGADAVILNVFYGDEPQIWDTPGQMEALRNAALPVLHLAQQPHVIIDRDQVSRPVGEFIASLSRRPEAAQ